MSTKLGLVLFLIVCAIWLAVLVLTIIRRKRDKIKHPEKYEVDSDDSDE